LFVRSSPFLKRLTTLDPEISGKFGHPSRSQVEGVYPSIADPIRGQEQRPCFEILEDPAAEIRAKASVLLARMAKQQAVKPLMEIILSEEFYKRDYDEKASFFRALAETGSQEVIPILQKIAGKKNLFGKGKWEEMRICATNTLRMLGVTPPPQNKRNQGSLESLWNPRSSPMTWRKSPKWQMLTLPR